MRRALARTFPNRPNKCQQSNNTRMDNPAETDNKKCDRTKLHARAPSLSVAVICHATAHFAAASSSPHLPRRKANSSGRTAKAKKSHANIPLLLLAGALNCLHFRSHAHIGVIVSIRRRQQVLHEIPPANRLDDAFTQPPSYFGVL